MLGSLGLLDLYNSKRRVFLPFLLAGVVFDSMRYSDWPALEGRIHVAGPYELDRVWFGVGGQTPCFSAVYLQHDYVIDVVLGIAYGAVAVAVVRVWERGRP